MNTCFGCIYLHTFNISSVDSFSSYSVSKDLRNKHFIKSNNNLKVGSCSFNRQFPCKRII